MVPVEHVADLGPVAAIVLARIGWRSERDGAWTATRQTIAAETGLPLRAVRGALDLLRDRGLLLAEQGLGYDRTMTWRPVGAGQAQGAESVTCMGTDSSLPCDESVPFQVTESATSSLETVETLETPPSSPPPVDPSATADQAPVLFLAAVPDLPPADLILEEFEGFWRAYPRRVGKQAALRSYRAARKVAPLEDIAAGLRSQLPGLEARPMDKRPHPATWLNQQRWADDPDHAAPVEAASRPRNALLDPHLMDNLPSLAALAAGGDR